MADWYPGAWRVSQGGNGNSITARPAENIFHIAASNWNVGVKDGVFRPELQSDGSIGIAGWNGGARACNGYNDQYGNMQQYCSVFSAVNGTSNGNWRNRTWESWNPEGLKGTEEQYNASKWTAEQCERFADLLAWDHNENGAVLENMGNSRTSSHGVGGHRYGIDPWRISGGESWTAHYGKTCPGTARMNQLDGIIARARVIAKAVAAGKCSYLPPGRVDLAKAYARTGDGKDAPSEKPKEWDEMATKDEIRAVVSEELDKRVSPTKLNDIVANVLRAPEFNVSGLRGDILKGRQEDVFRAVVDVLHAPEFLDWQREDREVNAEIREALKRLEPEPEAPKA